MSLINVVCIVNGQDTKTTPFSDFFYNANAAFKHHQYIKAILLYQDYLNSNDFHLGGTEPENPSALPKKFRPEVFQSCIQIAISFELTDQYDSALWFLRNGLNLFLQTGPTDVKMHALFTSQIATVYNLQGNFGDALEWYQQSLVLARGWKILEEDCFQNLGSLYFLREDYENAINYYRKALIMARSVPENNKTRIVDILMNLGTAWSRKEEFHKSIYCFSMADSILRRSKVPDNLRLAGLNLNEGEALLKLDNLIPAMLHFQSADEFASRSPVGSGNIRILSCEGMAECYSRLNWNDSAIALLRTGIEWYHSTVKPLNYRLAGIYLALGDAQSRGNDREQAISTYNRAFSILVPGVDTINIRTSGILLTQPEQSVLSGVFEHRGACFLELAKKSANDTTLLKKAYSDFLSALGICNNISKELGQELSRMLFQESTKSILTGALESGFLLTSRRDLPVGKDLFSIADGGRNRILLENLEEYRAMHLAGVPDSMIDRMKKMRSEIVFNARRFYSEESSPGLNGNDATPDLLSRITDLKISLDSLRQKTSKQYNYHGQLQQNDEIVSVAEVIKKLKDDEALIEYLHADSLLFIFLVRHDGLSVKMIKVSSSFRPTLREFMRSLKSAGTEHFQADGKKVYDMLLGPVESRLKDIRHLIIIPDEELALIPFEALIRENPETSVINHPSSCHYFLNDFDITYHYSAATWLHDSLDAGSLQENYCFTGFAPGFLAVEKEKDSYPPLPGSRIEISEIAALFGKTNPVSTLFTDSAATEENFRNYSPEASYIHIATHSLIDETDPENSALVFSGGSHRSENLGRDDGLLHLDEVTNLRLKASLVVLSACGTGKGKLTKTEGVLALTRGFYIAGASGILYTLWNIPDRITRRFMLSFYQGFLSGKSYSEALREAKLKMISRPETSLPYMWAGFVLLGR